MMGPIPKKPEDKVTPRPWRSQNVTFEKPVWMDFLNNKGMRCVARGQDIVAVTFDTEDDENPKQKDHANAAHIVKAVNMHEDLVSLLSQVSACLNTEFRLNSSMSTTWREFKLEIDRALAKAKGGE